MCEKGWQRGRKEKQLLCGHSCSAFILLPLQILFRLGKQRQEEEMMDRKQKKKGGEKFKEEMANRDGALSVPPASSWAELEMKLVLLVNDLFMSFKKTLFTKVYYLMLLQPVHGNWRDRNGG